MHSEEAGRETANLLINRLLILWSEPQHRPLVEILTNVRLLQLRHVGTTFVMIPVQLCSRLHF